MSNAMKKLKLLHHLTAASSTSLPPPAAAQQAQQAQLQQFPTPPALPISPQTSPIRHSYHPHNYNDVLRSARAALHTLHSSQPSYNPPPLSPPPTTTPSQPQCLLPGGFMVLTPSVSHNDTIPGLSVPASPPPSSMAIANPQSSLAALHSSQIPRGNTTIYSSRPPMSSHHHHTYTSQSSRPKPRPRLTREAVSKIGKDSRLARWERVLGYVRDQRSTTVQPDSPSLQTTHTPIAGETEGVAWASYAYGSTLSNTPPANISGNSRTKDRKRRASELAAIEAKTKLLDAVDIEEQDLRSLWSGGSGGTNGVDEFIWSEDDDDDILPMPQAPPPVKVNLEALGGGKEEEGIFDMEDTEMRGMKSSQRIPRTSQPAKPWGQRMVEEMPMLCREAELEGGLGRLVGRRMSAAY